jgi:GNAT superfamily N-acetyltransferase
VIDADALLALVDAALPDERLSTDDLLGVCWDDELGPSTVLGDEIGAASVAVREGLGAVQLLVVHPDARGEGRGRRLLDDATAWAFDNGAGSVVIGAAPPWYLWPGIDLRWTAGLVLAESAGFDPWSVAINLSCPTSVRLPAPEGVELRRVVEDADAASVVDLCRRAFAPAWQHEARRGIEHGACHAAFDASSGDLLGFAAHSVNRAGWFGPTGVDPNRQRRGVGGPLLAACLVDLQVAGFARCEISWIGPTGFYVKAAGAEVGRTFRIAGKRKP